MKRILTALVLSLTSFASHADTKIGFHLGSYHAPAKNYNNFNPGIYVRSTEGATIGAYYNSERRFSVYGGYTREWGPVSVTFGVITGYESHDVLPLVFPTVKLGQIGKADFRLGFLPRLTKNGTNVFHLMAEF